MEQTLIKAGLTELQASAYLFLLEHGESAPPALTKNLSITRSNAYKVLDSLEETGLATKHEVRKKFVFRPEDPTALATLVAQKRNEVIALEQHVNAAMHELRSNYQKSSSKTSVEVHKGKAALCQSYERQASTKQPIYFIKSRADIPFMGFEEMRRIRYLANAYDTPRFGITPDTPEAAIAHKEDTRTKLHRTWIESAAYNSPVEWTATDNELLIQIFSGEGRLVRITDFEVAEAFRELWKLLDTSLKKHPGYRKFPKQVV